MQRLRNINQVGLVSLIYPGARHSRFEHSLGVASLVKRLCHQINDNMSNSTEKATSPYKISDKNINKLILAALLHDVGHCCFSHLSEKIYGEFKHIQELQNAIKSTMDKSPNYHEILSFVIINTSTFKNNFYKFIDYPNKKNYSKNKDILFYEVGAYILGINNLWMESKTNQKLDKYINIFNYQTSIINGDTDADKLDYIKRDSHFAGIPIDYDIERFYAKLQIDIIDVEEAISIKKYADKSKSKPSSSPKEKKKIKIFRLNYGQNLYNAIDEISFSKSMLSRYIYNHQKVLCIDALVIDYIYKLKDAGKLNTISKFLQITENEVLTYSDETLKKSNTLLEHFYKRDFPRRCFEISSEQYLMEEETLLKIVRPYIESNFTSYSDYQKIRELFYKNIRNEYKNKNLKKQFSIDDILLAFPEIKPSENIKTAIRQDNKNTGTAFNKQNNHYFQDRYSERKRLMTNT